MDVKSSWLQILFLAVVFIFCPQPMLGIGVEPSWISAEHKLMHDLMEDYSNEVRPVSKPSDVVHVDFDVALIHIDELDESKGILYLNTWLRMSWNDVQLKWNTSDYDDITDMTISIEKLWKPDITLFNSFEDFSQAIHHTQAVVSSDGRILWVPPVFMASSCPVDLTDFPHDTQVCKLKFGCWANDAHKVSLGFFEGTESLDTSGMVDHHEFDLVNSERSHNKVTYPCCPNDPYEDITYTLHLKRAPHTINHMIVAPSVLLGLFLPLIFVLPPEFEEKVHFGIGFLVANILLLLLLVDVIPAGHPTIPAIGHYHMSNIILSCLALAVVVYIRNLWAKGHRGSRMPAFVKNYVLGICGRMMCVSRDDYMPVPGSGPSHSMRKLEVISGESVEDIGGSTEDDREQILRNYARNAQSAEWKQLAIIIDRLGFLFFLTMTVIITVAMATR